MSATATETPSKPASRRYGQFTLRALFFAVTLSAVSLTAWRYAGSVGLSYVAVSIVAIYLARICVATHHGALLGILIGANLVSLLGITLAYLEDWTYGFTFVMLAILMTTGALVGFGSAAFACVRNRKWGQMLLGGHSWLQIVLLAVSGVILGLCTASPWALEWHKMTRPEANITTYGVGDEGEQVYLFLGRGMNDLLLDDRLMDVPVNGRHSFVFHYTTVSDESIRRLRQFKNTVSLDLRGTLITDEGERELGVALPGCKFRR